MDKSSIVFAASTVRKLANRFIETELKAHGESGISPAYGAILNVLYKNGGKMQVVEISERISRSKSTTTELINKLERKGYVEKIKSSSDKRFTSVVLTEKGENIKPVFYEVSENLLEMIYKDIAEDEQEVLLRTLERIIDNLT